MAQLVLHFQVDVIEEQRQLNGTRYVSLEGGTGEDAGAWTVALNYGQPKEEDSSLEEGDLTLSGPGGSIFAGLTSGRADIVNDDIGGDERELLDLALRIAGGDGVHERAAGALRIRGELNGGQGQLDVEVSLNDPVQ